MAGLDATGVTSESEVKGFENLPAPADYLFLVKDVDASYAKQQAVIFECVVLASSAGSDVVGKTHRELYFLEKNGDYNAGHLAIGLVTGVIAPGTKDDHPDWSLAKNKVFVAHLAKRSVTKDGKTTDYSNIDEFGRAVRRPENPDVEVIMRTQAFSEAYAKWRQGPAGGGQPVQQQTQHPQQQQMNYGQQPGMSHQGYPQQQGQMAPPPQGYPQQQVYNQQPQQGMMPQQPQQVYNQQPQQGMTPPPPAGGGGWDNV